jgi:hypothetical protein
MYRSSGQIFGRHLVVVGGNISRRSIYKITREENILVTNVLVQHLFRNGGKNLRPLNRNDAYNLVYLY